MSILNKEFQNNISIGRGLLYCHHLTWKEYLDKFNYAFKTYGIKSDQLNFKSFEMFNSEKTIQRIKELPEVLYFCLMVLNAPEKKISEIGICVGFLVQVCIEFTYKKNKPDWYKKFIDLISQLPNDWISFSGHITTE